MSLLLTCPFQVGQFLTSVLVSEPLALEPQVAPCGGLGLAWMEGSPQSFPFERVGGWSWIGSWGSRRLTAAYIGGGIRWNLEVSMAAAVGGGQQGSRDAR